MTKTNFDDIDQIPVVHVSVQTSGAETLIKYESNDEKLLNEVINQIDKKAFVSDDPFIIELLIESMELYLRSHQRLDGESWNTLIEHAPLIAEKVADAHGMTRGEFRKYIAEQGEIKLGQLKRAILKI